MKTLLLFRNALLLFTLLASVGANAATKTSTGNGNWGTAATWSPSGVPASGDDVVILSGHTVTVDADYTCQNLTIGSNTNSNATVNVSNNYTFTITGTLTMNPNGKNKAFTLNAGSGTININGTSIASGGGYSICVGNGTVNINPAVNLSATGQSIVYTGAGTINFNGDFTDAQGSVTFYSGCKAYFNANYTVSSNVQSWGTNGTAYFSSTATITATTNITFNDVEFMSGTQTISSSGAGTVTVGGSVTLNSGAVLTTNKNFIVNGNWINNGGTIVQNGYAVIFGGIGKTIGGTFSTGFENITIGSGTTEASYTLESNTTCANLTLDATSQNRTLTLGNGVYFSVTGDVTINQPTGNSKTTLLNVNEGNCTINGNLVFAGSSSTATRLASVAVTSGVLTINGNVTWMSNTSSATEVITVSTGTINFTNSLTMGSASGTVSVTGTGTINFNGTIAPSLTFGGATAPSLSTVSGSILNFAKGITAVTTTLTLNAESQTNIVGSGTITPTAAITFGNLTVNPSETATIASGSTVTVAGDLILPAGSGLTANQNFTVGGNWINNGGTFTPNSYTVIFSGSGKTIGGTAVTDFNDITIGSGTAEASYTLGNNATCANLTFDANTQNRTLTLGNAVNFSITGDVTINQPTASSKTSLLDVNSGNCTIYGNLIFAGTNATATRIGSVTVTSGVLTINGNVTWMSNTSSATEVITVNTGTINFNTSLTMGSASGTVSVTDAGTINFNGNAAPSLAFGGSTAPVFTTASGSTINFAKGFSATTTALTFEEGANIISGSTESPVNFSIVGNTTVTNNGILTVYGDLTGSAANSTFVNGANASLTLNGSAMSTGTFTTTASGNTVIYNGNSVQTVKAGTYDNLIFQNTGVKTFDGNITAKNFTLSEGALDDGGYTLTISSDGRYTNNGGTYTSTGGVTFTGSSASQIDGTVAAAFNNFTMNNSGGVTFKVPVTLNGALTLTNGVITSSEENYLHLTNTATSSEGSAASYVDGTMIKTGNTDFTFPVGNGGRWRRVGVSGMTDPATEITAQYFYASPPDASSLAQPLTEVSNEEYWDVNRTGSNDPVKIRLYWESIPLASLEDDCSKFTVVHHKNGKWEKEPSMLVSDVFSCLSSSGSIETDYVTSFSPFGFGAGSGNVLPIKLVSFDAVVKDNIVETNWVTSLEIDNDYFTLERSSNGENWEEVARVSGAGNSTSLLSYSQLDKNPLFGTSYYRLKQTDFDGKFAYSNIVAVTIKKEAQTSFTLYPNPTDNELFVKVANPSEEVKIEIYDLAGRVMYAKIFSADGVGNAQTIALQAKYLLPTGVYILSVTTNGTVLREKMFLR